MNYIKTSYTPGLPPTSFSTVIFHSADYDGIFCREIARKFIPGANLIGWNYGDPKIVLPATGDIYILDLSPECLTDNPAVADRFWARIVWIDHHKTAIEKWPSSLKGYRIDGVAACRLAWQWFSLWEKVGGQDMTEDRLPTKPYYEKRLVSEPMAVRLAGEYDVWDKRDPNADTLQYGLRVISGIAGFRESLLDMGRRGNRTCEEVLRDGRIAQRYAEQMDASACTYTTFTTDWEGLRFLTVNRAQANSLFFKSLDLKNAGHDALMSFYFDGMLWKVSLYHSAHHPEHDLSVIAKKYGGGGHAGACGMHFESPPPFLTQHAACT